MVASAVGADTAFSNRPWFAHYPDGVPHTIDPTRFNSLWEMLAPALLHQGDRVALRCLGHPTSYAELDQLSRAFAGWLQSQKLSRGARVAVMLPNLPQYYVAVLGILRAGYVVVNVNPLYTARELEHQLSDSGAEVIVLLENFAHTFVRAVEHTTVKHVVVTALGDLLGSVRGTALTFALRHFKHAVPPWTLPDHHAFTHVLREGAKQPFAPALSMRDDLAFLQYTGGTTGAAKGAMLSHGNLIAGVLSTTAWSEPALRDVPDTEERTVLLPLPLYHIFALLIGLTWVHLGACAILVPNPRDIHGLIRTMRRNRFHQMIGVNTLFNALVRHPDFPKVDFSHCRATVAGGMAAHHAVSERWQAITGHPLCEGYGLTETVSAVSCNCVDSHQFTGTIGLPFPSMDFAVRDDNDRDVPPGQPGELVVRGPQVMVGYWQRPDETAKSMSPDGYFRTGDIAIMEPSGYFRIVDRKKDMILVSGFNVYPNEIEDVVASHPGVAECAVIGVPDEHCGETVKLFVVPRDANAVTAADLAQLCKQKLTAYKRPRQIAFVAHLPKSPVGKVLRRALRDNPPSEITPS
jgi:long-chain acyl-CoA synthetase